MLRPITTRASDHTCDVASVHWLELEVLLEIADKSIVTTDEAALCVEMAFLPIL